MSWHFPSTRRRFVVNSQKFEPTRQMPNRLSFVFFPRFKKTFPPIRVVFRRPEMASRTNRLCFALVKRISGRGRSQQVSRVNKWKINSAFRVDFLTSFSIWFCFTENIEFLFDWLLVITRTIPCATQNQEVVVTFMMIHLRRCLPNKRGANLIKIIVSRLYESIDGCSWPALTACNDPVES